MATMRNHLNGGGSRQAHSVTFANSIVACVSPRPTRLTAGDAPVTSARVWTGEHSTRNLLAGELNGVNARALGGIELASL
jgi:hypothetical protein